MESQFLRKSVKNTIIRATETSDEKQAFFKAPIENQNFKFNFTIENQSNKE
jgi:hypothetical protein